LAIASRLAVVVNGQQQQFDEFYSLHGQEHQPFSEGFCNSVCAGFAVNVFLETIYSPPYTVSFEQIDRLGIVFRTSIWGAFTGHAGQKFSACRPAKWAGNPKILGGVHLPCTSNSKAAGTFNEPRLMKPHPF
jgi:hypothetical protein